MGDGNKANPYTREDVERLIEGNIGKAKGLYLIGKNFEEGIDLSGLNLEGAIFKDAGFSVNFKGKKPISVIFNGSNLSRADFRLVNLEYSQFGMLDNRPTCLQSANFQSTILLNASFRGADLSRATFGKTYDIDYGPAIFENTDFRNANLFLTNFKGCFFYGTKFEGVFIRGVDIDDAHLDDVAWGNFKLGEETARGNQSDLSTAEHYYRRLKTWYTEHGIYDVAGEFFFREMEAKRKAQSWKNEPASKFFNWAIKLLCGYGERYGNVVVAALVIIFGLAVVYVFGGLNLAYAIYFSAVSFTALGYGSWAHTPAGWIQGLGAAESFLGVFMMALFLVTFTRKMTR